MERGGNEDRRFNLKFLGAAGTVTGSKYVLEAGRSTVMVDCGLFQGLKQLRLRNRTAIPIDLSSLDAVLLTHGHLDHSGYLPVLVRDGFKGPIFCTKPTRDLCEVLLRDSARLQEEEAEFANRHGFSKHHPALPLYTVADADRALTHLRAVEFDERVDVSHGVTAAFVPAGHMLGAASIRVEAQGKSVLFSGDLGRNNDALLHPPRRGTGATYVVMESTYGNRSHTPGNAQEVLASVLTRTFARGGIVVIPAFAVGRAQTLMYLIHRAKQAGQIPDVPVYLDSPMAIDATKIFHRHRKWHRLSAEECEGMCQAARIVNSADESKWLDSRHMPMVIIAGSGMATGGRVIHHIKALGSDPRNTILFAGFQAAGTRGAAMVAGADSVKIHGQYVPIKAEVVNLDMLSAHADREELLDWLSSFQTAPRKVFITHGEPIAADALRLAIQERLGWACAVPDHGENEVL
ncbi:MAG TPA: MBL fold metallo-hydrolase [Burkholderiales bacterium]|nr:MBL fold metallo-hydrolase [Burkholderiales bacterium]